MSGDLIHINRYTQEIEPALAKSWTVSPDGKQFTLQLRRGIRFSDGSLFDADDVVFSKLSGPADLTGKKEVQKGLEESFKAFPDVKLDVKSAWSAGDYVVATGTWSGTNTGVPVLAV